ncbi:MAG: hypothetical protein U0263_19175 [Polyangiaceae bacterium]
MNTFALALTGLSTAWTLLGTLSVIRVTRGQRLPASVARELDDPLATHPIHGRALERAGRARSLSPVSILKPLCGKDAGLADNLESFFVQDHPCFELVFGVQREDDPAIGVVRELERRFPDVSVKLVVHPGGTAIEIPRSTTCSACSPPADLLLISDSNVHALRTTCRRWSRAARERSEERPRHQPVRGHGRGQPRLGARERTTERLLRRRLGACPRCSATPWWWARA